MSIFGPPHFPSRRDRRFARRSQELRRQFKLAKTHEEAMELAQRGLVVLHEWSDTLRRSPSV